MITLLQAAVRGRQGNTLRQQQPRDIGDELLGVGHDRGGEVIAEYERRRTVVFRWTPVMASDRRQPGLKKITGVCIAAVLSEPVEQAIGAQHISQRVMPFAAADIGLPSLQFHLQIAALLLEAIREFANVVNGQQEH